MEDKWKRVSTMRPGPDKFNDFLSFVQKAADAVVAENEDAAGDTRTEKKEEKRKSAVKETVKEETPRRKSIVQERISSLRKSMSSKSLSSSKDEQEGGESGERRVSISQRRVSQLSRKSMTEVQAGEFDDSASTTSSKQGRKSRRKSLVQERIAALSRKSTTSQDTEMFYSAGSGDEASRRGSKMSSISRLSKRLSASIRSSLRRQSGSDETSGSTDEPVPVESEEFKDIEEEDGEVESSAVTGDVDDVVVEVETSESVAVEGKPKKKGGNFGSLLSLFSSGKVSNIDSSKKKRESVERLEQDGVRHWTKRKSKAPMHPMSLPTDELKWVLSKDPKEGEKGKSGEASEEPIEEVAPPTEEELARRRTVRMEKLKSIRFSVAPEKCEVCDKTVYRMEKLTDSKDRAFHWSCLKCADCIGVKTLVGEKVHVCEQEDEETGEVSKFVLCDTHFYLRKSTTTIVKGWRPDTSHINHGGKYDDDVDGARKVIRKSLQMTMGRKPVCTRCGGEINLKDKDFIVSGMERYHLQCPDKGSIKHTPRHFVLGVPERFPLLFCVDPKSKRAYSFLFKISQESKEVALTQHRLQPARLSYVPDGDAYSSTVREIRTTNEHFLVFDQKKTFQEINHPVTGVSGFTRYDPKKGIVVAQLYKEDGGVVHGLHAALGYTFNEKTKVATVEALTLELTFELISQEDYVSPVKGAKGVNLEPPSLVLEDDFVERVSAMV